MLGQDRGSVFAKHGVIHQFISFPVSIAQDKIGYPVDICFLFRKNPFLSYESFVVSLQNHWIPQKTANFILRAYCFGLVHPCIVLLRPLISLEPCYDFAVS